MSPRTEVRVGIVGLGYIGRAHLAAYEAANHAGWPCRVVAICDHKAGALEGLPAPAHADAGELLCREDVDLVSVCTRTDSHVDLGLAALRAGKHVLVEKPVAITARAAAPLAAATAAPGAPVCVPAHCMRFWPGWDLLREAVRSNRWGRVKSATFRRLSSAPAWAQDFYSDHASSGGALVDLHIHDADFVRWCFGDPAEVVSTGSLDHVTSLYRFPGGPAHVVAEGGWDHAPGFGFRMRYTVVFEAATLDFDLGREPALLLAREGRSEAVPLAPGTGYDGEVRHVLDLVLGRAREPAVTMADALAVARLLDAERKSLETGAPVRPSG